MHHSRIRSRHPDLEIDRLYADPFLPFGAGRFNYDLDYDYREREHNMVEDRMDTNSLINLIGDGPATKLIDKKTPQNFPHPHPPTTSSSSLATCSTNSFGASKKLSSSSTSTDVPLLLDLNVDIIDDDGPFSLKSKYQQQQQGSSSSYIKLNKRTPTSQSQLNEASEFQPTSIWEDEIITKKDKGNNDEDDYEEEKNLLTNCPSHCGSSAVDGGSGDGSSSWLPVDLFQHQHNNLGLKITSGSVTITKDGNTNMIGISIGGGAPNCPCLYIVQVFDNTPSAKDGTLQSGDEITGVNNVSVKGKTKVEVAKMIQSIQNEVTISYNKLHADAAQGKSLDIILKKVKHRLVENMSSATADALGLSRAILCNDNLVKKLADLQRTEVMYRGLVEHTQRLLRAYLELLRVVKLFGETFAVIGAREPQPRASLAFTQFADYHRQMEKRGVEMVKKLKPILSDLGTYLHKAIPDTKLTIGKYADAKFEYLSFCLKVKEMDDEEFNYASVQEPLYRVETGNYEYRLVLRCRQEARARFAQLRSDVQVKLELLDNKHVQDVAAQLQKLSKGLAEFYDDMNELSKENANLFPVEVDLTDNAFIYEKSFEIFPPDENVDDE